MDRSTPALVHLAGGLIAGVVVLAGCSAGADGTTAGGSATAGTSTAASATFNDEDVVFVNGMIPHHRGAVAMAQMADGRAQDPRVVDLAARIEAAQEPEIQTMTGWLEEWGEPLPEDTNGGPDAMDHGAGHGGGTDMGGMSEEDMSALENATGVEFDRLFLELMIEHHRGAVEMATTEIAEGRNPDAVGLARAIAQSQTAEIEEMQGLQAAIGG